MKRGSIELARSQCEYIAGDLPEGEQYGSVDVAEILSAEVERLNELLIATALCDKAESERILAAQARRDAGKGLPGDSEMHLQASDLSLAREELLKQQARARQDDWHRYFVGSDIRILIGKALAALDAAMQNKP